MTPKSYPEKYHLPPVKNLEMNGSLVQILYYIWWLIVLPYWFKLFFYKILGILEIWDAKYNFMQGEI